MERTSTPEQLAKRRALLAAIYAMQTRPPQILIDEHLAQNLERAGDEYDDAIRGGEADGAASPVRSSFR